MTTNPEVLRLARELMTSSFESEDIRHSVLHGSYDDAREIRIAIAAIVKTTELSIEMLKRDTSEYSDKVSFVLSDAAESFERYDHLRQPEKGSIDE